METIDDLKRRIDQASRYMPLDQLALSPQCGFGGIDSKVLREEEMWRKLDRIVERAWRIWEHFCLVTFVAHSPSLVKRGGATLMLHVSFCSFVDIADYFPSGHRMLSLA